MGPMLFQHQDTVTRDTEGDCSPLGFHSLPRLVNPPCWKAAMVWWFGLFVSYKVQSHRTCFASGRLLKYMFVFDYGVWGVGFVFFFSLFVVFF